MPSSALRPAVRVVAVLAIAAVAGVGALLGALWFEHQTPTTLPAPTGTSPVGRVIVDWVDEATIDRRAPLPATRRELLVWIWYPASIDAPAATDDYVPAASRAAVERLRSRALPAVLINQFFTRDLARVHAHSLRAASVAPAEHPYPVVILRGGASASVAMYTTLAEDLASHGYVVAGIDAPFRTTVVAFPDGRAFARTPENNPERCAGRLDGCIDALLATWIADIGYTIDRLAQLNAGDPWGPFTGRLDMSRLGVVGHSFGGAQAAQFCHDDRRCAAGIDIDGMPFGTVIRDGLQPPFMFLLSSQIHQGDAESRRVGADIQSIYDRQPAARRLRVAIRGANHFLFSDDGALLKSHLVIGALRATGVLGIDGPRQLDVTAYCVRSFFDAFLKARASASPINLRSPRYPEIEVLE